MFKKLLFVRQLFSWMANMGQLTTFGRKIGSIFPWLMLIARSIIFLGFQCVLAFILFVAGHSAAWQESIRWWPFAAAFANIVCILLLRYLYALEGKSYWHVFRFAKDARRQDSRWLLIMVFLGLPLAILPNLLLSELLFTDPMQPVKMMFLPLPPLAYAFSFIFPLTIGLAELPTYFAYVFPRLSEQLKNPSRAWFIVSFFLTIQHIFLPWINDWRYLLWRSLMYLPFAYFTGWVLWKRPGMLPYYAIMHTLMDISTMMVYLIP